MTARELVRRDALDGATLDLLATWVSDIEHWPVGSHVWGQYAEQSGTTAVVCRTENVSACHPGVARLVDGMLADVAADELGVAVTAFKDKINYKPPGGAGFGPHQDVVAYPGARRVVSLLVAVDVCTVASGCVWIAPGVDRLLPTDGRGVVTSGASAALSWQTAELAPGDVLCIDGLAPHRSDANRTDRPRRVLVASYAPTADGYGRDRYYAARRNEMGAASGLDGSVRMSTLADFEGTIVHTPSAVVSACTHG